MTRNDCGRSRCPAGSAAGKLALTILVALTVASPAPGAANKDKDQEFTRVYQHTYDEVFQASQETIERMGLFLTDKDKDKGTISGNGNHVSFDILVETLNTKPETKVTINAKAKVNFLDRGIVEKAIKRQFLSELQKVLSTYR